MTCLLCSPQKNVIALTEFWTVNLNDDQGFLGRCFFALNRHETDVTHLTEAETQDLWRQFGLIKTCLDQLWAPDHYNYAFLMNVQPHVHGHIIPRYAASREFGGVKFTDGRLGEHYVVSNSNFPGEELLGEIAREIGSRYDRRTEVAE